MKKLIASTLFMSTLSVHAYGQFSHLPEDTARMLGSADEVGACMSKLDQDYLARLSDKNEAKEREIRRLCEAGKRTEAQIEAESLARELMADPQIQKSMECTALLGLDEDDEDEGIHVCDDLDDFDDYDNF